MTERAAPAVVVPMDGSPEALVALPVAREMARMEGARLVALHVASPAPDPGEVARRVGLSGEEARELVFVGMAGPPAECILQCALSLGGALVVMCSRTGPEREGHHGLGPVAEDLLSRARVPLLLVRPERGRGAWRLTQMLVPCEGTPSTIEPLQPACEMARRAGAAVVLLHVATPQAARPREEGTMQSPRYVDQPQHEWPAWMQEFLDRILSLTAQVPTAQQELYVAQGRPSDEILRVAAARKVDLVVLAFSGHLEGQRGETVKAILERAQVPVLVLPQA